MKNQAIKNKLILQVFQSNEVWHFPLRDNFFPPRDIQVSSNMQIGYWWHHKVWSLTLKTQN